MVSRLVGTKICIAGYCNALDGVVSVVKAIGDMAVL